MSRYKNALTLRDYHILSLRLACGALALVCVVAMVGWMRVPSQLTIHNPPDLRSGSTRLWWEIDPSTVYGFAFYVFQQLNSWSTNGQKDYPDKIDMLTHYLTPACKIWLKGDARSRDLRGESSERVRTVAEIPGRGVADVYRDEQGTPMPRVKILGRDNWVVTLDLVIDEYYQSEKVKRSLTRFPLKVVRWAGDPELNPFGLALDCYDGLPQRLEAAVAAEEK